MEDLVSKYIKLANVGMKNMEAIQKSQLASIQDMESQLKNEQRLIHEKPIVVVLHNSEEKLDEHENTVTLRNGKELVEPLPTIMD